MTKNIQAKTHIMYDLGNGSWGSKQAVVSFDSTMAADYDADWTYNAAESRAEHPSGLWTTLDTGHAEQTMSIDPNGVKGNCLKIAVTAYGADGLAKFYPLYEDNRYKTLDAPDGHNRAFFYTKIPPSGGTHTFHWGTYSKNPATANQSSNLGNHWYHYYEFRGQDAYWMKVYFDERPTHVVSSSETVETNPTSGDGFDYFDGLTRAYWQMRYSPFEASFPGPYDVLFDELQFYTETRPENDFSVNNVVISYFGNGEFDIDWVSWSPYEVRVETFEVRYSTSPINDLTDWANATTIPAMPAGGWGIEHVTNYENHIRASFIIPNMNESLTYYFAIQDLFSGHTNSLKRVDYNVQEINGV